jgi:hypothetical protein
MLILELFRYRNDSFQSDIFSSDIRITDVVVGCKMSDIGISQALRSVLIPPMIISDQKNVAS